MRLHALHAAIVALVVFTATLLPVLFVTDDAHSVLAHEPPRGAAYRFDSLSALDPAADALVIVAPSVGYESAEIEQLSRFLRAGGRVLLADGGGVARQLVTQLGSGLDLTGISVYTPGFSGTPDQIVTLSTGAVALPSEVVLTRPVTVSGGIPVLVTPELAWHDLNGNGRPDLGEPLAPAAVAALAGLGGGELLVVGHPDAVLRGDALTDALLAWASDDGARRLVFDEAHRARSDPLAFNALLATRLGAMASTAILMGVLGVGAFVALGPRWSARPSPPAKVRVDDALLREALLELEQ